MKKNDILDVNYVFNGTQEEMNKFIIKDKNYIVPIAKWEKLRIYYNKLDGLFQQNLNWEDIHLYFEPAMFQTSLTDIKEYLEKNNAPDSFIKQVIDLLFDNELDTYKYDMTDEEIDRINKLMEEQEIVIDTKYYKTQVIYEDKNTIVDDIFNFEPSSLSSEYDNLENTYTEDEIEKSIQEQEEWYKKEKNRIQQWHIDNCYKDNKKVVRPPYFVYLAGKIKQNGWRESIVGYRCGGLYGDTDINIVRYKVKYNDNTIITGPWFFACDHGCYHGENSHGVGIQCPNGCYGENTLNEDQVYDICTKQINNSNVIFAYIDDNTCYGSLWEIGYAKAKGKHIVIVFSNEKLMSDMWFICQGADTVTVIDENTSLKDKFDEIINNLNVKKC